MSHVQVYVGTGSAWMGCIACVYRSAVKGCQGGFRRW